MQRQTISISFLVALLSVTPVYFTDDQLLLPAYAEVSPRQQIDNNIKPFDVICNDNLTQVFKMILLL